MTLVTRLAGPLCLLLLGCSTECALDDDMHLFAGDGATDCGTADASHDRVEVDQCATDAFEAGKAFMARYAETGQSSKLVTAVAGNTAGKVKVFRWTDSPSAVTDVQSCDGPSVRMATADDPSVLPISCESLGLAQRVCG